jgi:hypothetical protein
MKPNLKQPEPNKMSRNTTPQTAVLAAAMAAANTARASLDKPALDLAFDALKSYDYGSGRAALVPIDEAVVAALSDSSLRLELEQRLAALLPGQISRVAKDYVCSKLVLIGSAASVPAVAALLGDKDVSHLALTALAAIPSSDSTRALRQALPKLTGPPKAGAIDALGFRRDPESVPLLAKLLEDSDVEIARAAAAALGNIGNSDAVQVLQQFKTKAPETLQLALCDSTLACAEHLAGAGKRSEALAIYKSLNDSKHPKHVQLAARRGLLMAVQKPQ